MFIHCSSEFHLIFFDFIRFLYFFAAAWTFYDFTEGTLTMSLFPYFSCFFFFNRLHSCLCPPGLQCAQNRYTRIHFTIDFLLLRSLHVLFGPGNYYSAPERNFLYLNSLLLMKYMNKYSPPPPGQSAVTLLTLQSLINV